jgi:hypothetical protein
MSKRKREQQQSFKADKAVADNIVESWLCIDCGVDTAPGCLSGPDLRVALALASDDEGVPRGSAPTPRFIPSRTPCGRQPA